MYQATPIPYNTLTITCRQAAVLAAMLGLETTADNKGTDTNSGIVPKFGGYTYKRKLVVVCNVIGRVDFNTNSVGTMNTSLFVLHTGDTFEKKFSITNLDDKLDETSGDMCTSIKTKCSYFTMPHENTVYKFVDSKLSNSSVAFKTTGRCYGITGFADGLAVSMEIETSFDTSSEWQIQLLDFNGKLKKQIFHGQDGRPLFQKPLFLASNKTETKLFVSDEMKGAVIALSADGAVLYECSTTPSKPLGLAVDCDENIYAACGDCVVQIERAGANKRTILPMKKQGDQVCGVCFDEDRKMLVTIQRSAKLTFFSF